MKTTFTDTFSEEVFEQTYSYKGENVDDMHARVAKAVSMAEKTPELQEKHEEEFKSILQDFKFVPGGRILSNAGAGLKGTSLINCFVSGAHGYDIDSMDGIFDELRRQAHILKSEGGYGTCFDFIRPRGAFIAGIASESPGAIKMAEMWDTQSSVITSGSGKKSTNPNAKNKIRKGAQMMTMSTWHPDIEEFITAKQTPGRLTKFNMSILITDAFMHAVKHKLEWKLEFPDIEWNKEEYKKKWTGDLAKWKESEMPVIVYKTFSDANELWDLIMESTYNRNEPGVLFIDTINKRNNLNYIEHISGTNPCLTGDTMIATDKGNFCISELVEKQFNAIVDGKVYPSTEQGFWSNGTKEVYEIELANGAKIRATGNHKFGLDKEVWKNVKEMKEGDKINMVLNNTHCMTGDSTYEEGYFIGHLIGDGTFTTTPQGDNQPVITIWNDDEEYEPKKRLEDWANTLDTRSDFKGFGHARGKEYRLKTAAFIKIAKKFNVRPQEKKVYEYGSSVFTKGMLQGLFDTDGSVQGTIDAGFSVRLSQSNLPRLQAVQRLLLGFSITSSIYKRRDEHKKMMPDGKGGEKEYLCKTQYEVVISGKNVILFNDRIGFIDDNKNKKLGIICKMNREWRKINTYSKIKTIIKLETEEEVFDCTIPGIHCFSANGFLSHNCGKLFATKSSQL